MTSFPLRRRPDVRRRWLSVREIAARGGRALRLLRHAEFVDLTAQSSLLFDVRHGQVAEWLKAPVSKTGIPERVSRVRISPCPPAGAAAYPSRPRRRFHFGDSFLEFGSRGASRLGGRVAFLFRVLLE